MQNVSDLRTVEWKNNKVIMIDQTKLPNILEYVTYTDYNQVADAIRTLVVRGAPAIGVSGAFGLALAALQSDSTEKDDLINYLENAKKILFETRPTAVNLAWGLDKIMEVANNANSVEEIRNDVMKYFQYVKERRSYFAEHSENMEWYDNHYLNLLGTIEEWQTKSCEEILQWVETAPPYYEEILEQCQSGMNEADQMKYASEPMDIALQLLKERVSPEAKRHKLEYDKKYESTPERVKYREELNRERRRRGIYGSHDHKDISHTEGGKLTLEGEHENRARHFKDKGTLREL